MLSYDQKQFFISMFEKQLGRGQVGSFTYQSNGSKPRAWSELVRSAM